MRKKYEYAYNSPIFRVDILGLNVQGGFAFSGWDLGGYNEDKFFKDRAGGRNNPNVGLGSSGTDLLSHLENLSKQEKDCCIKDFRIAGHGWGSHNDGIPSSSENFESGFVLDKSDQDNYSPFDNKVADINDLSAKITDGSIKFCKQCTISIYACRMSDAFIEALGRATGCTVTASGGACRENQKGDGWETNADKKGDINQFRKSVAGAKAKNAGRIHVPIPFK